jgi:Fic family protein
MSIHTSTAIEGNRLTLSQVKDVINGIPVVLNNKPGVSDEVRL